MSSAAEFLLGSCRIEPDRNRLARGEQVIAVEPLVMNVLMLLVAHGGQVVSRDQLVEQVWAGRIVGDDAITRAVGQLRKALGDSAAEPRYIETIAKKGYRLLCSAQPLLDPAPVLRDSALATTSDLASATTQNSVSATTENAEPTTVQQVVPAIAAAAFAMDSAAVVTAASPAQHTPAATPAPHRQRLPFAFVALLLVGLTTYGWLHNKKPELKVSASLPLTDLAGVELMPRFAPNGNELAFTSDTGAGGRIAVQSLQTGRVVTLAGEPDCNDSSPVFAPDGKRLAFHRACANRSLYMAVGFDPEQRQFDVPLRLHQAHHSVGFGSIAWQADGEHVLYVDANDQSDTLKLFRLNTRTGRREQLTNPGANGVGDYFVWHQPGQEHALLLRYQEQGKVEVQKFSLPGRSSQLLLTLPYVVSGITETGSGELVFTDPEGRMWLQRNGERRSLLQAPQPLLTPASDGASRLAYATGQHRLQRALLHTGDTARPLDADHQESDLLFRYAPQSARLLFVRQLHGRQQLWLQREDGTLEAITQFEELRQIRTINWSPDERKLVFDDERGVHVIDLQERSLLSLTLPFAAEQPAFFDTESLLLASDHDGDWQLWQVPLKQPAAARRLTSAGGYRSWVSNNRELIYSKYYEQGLYRRPLDAPAEAEQLLLADFPAAHWDCFEPRTDRLLWCDASSGGLQIKQLSLSAPASAELIAELPTGALPQFSYSPLTQTLVYAQTEPGNTRLAVVRLED